MPPWTANPSFLPPKAGEPDIHRAARMGDVASIRRLAAEGADLDGVFDIGLDPGALPWPATPLMVAAGSGDGASVETVEVLLELGADQKFTVDGESAATFACSGLGWNYRPGGDAARLQRLLEAGSPLPDDLSKLNRLLCRAAATGDTERVRVLLARGVSARGHFDAEDARKRYRTMMAGMARCRESFYANMPEGHRAEMMERAATREQAEEELRCSAPDSHEIPLFCAAESGAFVCVHLLLEAGAEPTARDNSRRTAMYCANSAAVARELVNAGVPLEDADWLGWSPLIDAVSEGEAGLPRVRALLEAGANVNGTHDRGYTAFMSAVGGGRRNLDVLRLLVASGADAHAVSELGYNAFHAAVDVDGGDATARATLGYLKELGVDIERRNKAGHTPLARAIQDGRGVEVQALCELGADPNAVCPKHECGADACVRIDLPLLFHAADGVGVHADVKTEALLRAGADPLSKDEEGCTPLMLAVGRLCSDAPDYEAAYDRFFEDLRQLRLQDAVVPSTRDSFLTSVFPLVRGYVEAFAANIPVVRDSEFAEQWRAENLACVALLTVYEAWARHERLRRNGS